MSIDLKKIFRRPGRKVVPYIVLLGGLLFTGVVCFNLAAIDEDEDRARFSGTVRDIASSIENRIEMYEALLRATSGLFAASDQVTRNEFRLFVSNLRVEQNYPGIQGIGFSARVDADTKDALIERMRKEVKSDFRIWPEDPRDEYHTIAYLEPLDERNLAAIGYDMFSEPVRRAAMAEARDSGKAAATRAVVLVQEIDPANKQPGFLIYLPVYRNGSDVSTIEARRAALIGYVYSPFRVGDLLAGILPGPNYDVGFRVFDGSDSSNSKLLFDSMAGTETSTHTPRYVASVKVPVASESWTLNFASQPAFETNSGKNFIPYALLGGLMISLLFFAVTQTQLRAREAAERAAGELRQSEAIVRQTLADRERTEEALRESEERYRELVEGANDIVYTFDIEGRLSSINEAGETITGYSPDELIGRHLSEVLTPASAELSQRMLERKLAGEERTSYEVDLRAKSGRIVTLEISSRLGYKDGQPVAIQGIARDITLRRRAEEALREADQRALVTYEKLLERIEHLSQALGSARDLTNIFRALCEFSVASAPCNGLFVSLYDPITNCRTACYAWGDGEEVDVSQLPPMPVTAHGPNSRAIRSGEVVITDNYMSAQRGHPTVIVGTDNGLRPESSLSAPMAVMGRIVGTIEIQSYTRHAYREEHITAMRMAANLTAVAVENVRLLERESTARAVAEESNRLKDEFLATVSHELRTPLTAILGWSRMLESGSLDAEAAAKAIETIRRNAKSQSQIIDDILDVSRIITGNLYLDLQPIEIAPVIDAAINVVRPTAEAKRIRIETDFEARPTVISGDANRLQQVIWNLLSNAIKFTPADGFVRISARQTMGHAEISVTDSGQGIDRDFLPFVFDRFRQADSTTTRQHGGLGLGLAIARHLVEIHGGTIYASSAGKGAGSTFAVQLPLLHSLAAKARDGSGAAIAAETIPVLSGLHVLLVDDDKDSLELLATALRQSKAEVTAVSSSNQALAAVKSLKPDVLVSDIAMPESDGYDLIRRLRKANGEVGQIPAVAITAYAKEEDRARALSSGFQYYVAKPVEPADLIRVVATAAGRN